MKGTDLYYPVVEPNHPEYNPVASMEVGISVRDKLAESAMIGICSNIKNWTINDVMETAIAERAYRIADSMIKQSQIKP